MSVNKVQTAWRRRLLVTASLMLGSALLLPAAVAASGDYRFELAGPIARSGNATVVKVRLVHVPDGKPISGAVIVDTKFDMGPEGMPTMTAPAKNASTQEADLYQFETQPAMPGNWGLTLAAKVPGEAETVRGTVTVSVPK